MLLLQLDAVTTAVDVAAIATSVVGVVAGFLAVLLLGKYVVIPGLRRIVRSRGGDRCPVRATGFPRGRPSTGRKQPRRQ
ncbi:hypothetical protein DJ79_08665 [Halorubrum ezzemoulense]|uniref:Uncharacterized protein n=1 Tax=Halorubrum ezzemoulense TaxID=337243 RepID=A0A256JF70_HALEZ|nr:hypothetical protein DJ79_08665 [Halorubrum ezzemoulense]